MAGERSTKVDDTIDDAPGAPGADDAPSPGRRQTFNATQRIDDPALTSTIEPETIRHGAPRAVTPEVGGGRYLVREELGRGALGRVLAAHDTLLDRAVALKDLLQDGADARQRFDREILLTARLQHPCIVPIYDAGESPNRARFYAMKLVRGRPLSEVLARARTLEARLGLLPSMLAVADAIAYAHGEGIVHRDLKPENVLVGAHGETVVIDWGLAKDLGPREQREARRGRAGGAPQTTPGTLLGTPAYMPPEQAIGREVDERADVYALGAMLYHLIAGVPPHDGDSLEDLLGRIIQGAIVPVTRHEPRTPAPLSAIIAKAMARTAEDRYPTARELADDLRRYTTDQLVGAHRYSLAERVGRQVRRNAAAIAVSLVLAAFAGWSLWSLRRAEESGFETARLELGLAVSGIRRDVAFSLDQADPLLGSLRMMADPALPLAEVAPRMHDLVVGRPGVANASIGFASGLFRGTFVADGEHEIQVQQSEVGEGVTTRRNYRIRGDRLVAAGQASTEYDVRRRPHFALAARTHARVWTPPRTYFTSRSTGITCAEPVYDADGALRAVTTVDFDTAALSAFLEHPPLAGTRAILFAADGSVLALPSTALPDAAMKEGRLLRHQDFGDPVIDALVVDVERRRPTDLRVIELRAGGEDYLVAVSPIGGRRAGVEAPLDWYVAAMAPASILLAPAREREQQARIVLVAALTLVPVVAFGWLLLGARRRRR